MAGVDGSIHISTKLDTSGMTSGLGKVNSGLSGISSTLGKLGSAVAAAFSVTAVISFGKACIEAAADVNAASSQFEQTFSGMQTEAEAAIQSIADSSGILETRLQSVGTSIYAFAKTTGMESSDALGLMERALTVTADSAAYYDRSLEDTAESLKSFLKGNYENDSALGLSCTETTRNAKANELYGKSFDALSESQKQFTLLAMVESANELSGALGQAARESDGWENVTGNLTESLTQLQAAIGQPLLAAAVPIVQSLTEWMQQLSERVTSCYDAIADWVDTLDLSGLSSSIEKLQSSIGKLFAHLEESANAVLSILRPVLKWLIETALPVLVDGLSGVIDVLSTIFGWAAKLINWVVSGITAIINGVKAAVVAFCGLFGLDAPSWALNDTDLTNTSDNSDLVEETDDLADSYDSLTDSAEDAADAIEDAADAVEDEGDAASKAQRDLMGFDQINRLSDQSGSSSGSGSDGSGSGSSSDGSGSGSSSTVSAATGTDTASAETVPEKTYTVAQTSKGAEAAESWIPELGFDFDANIRLNLVKSSGFDDLKAEWDSIKDSDALKKLKASIEVEIKAAVQLAVSAVSQQENGSGTQDNSFRRGHSGSFGGSSGSFGSSGSHSGSYGSGSFGSSSSSHSGSFGKSSSSSSSGSNLLSTIVAKLDAQTTNAWDFAVETWENWTSGKTISQKLTAQSSSAWEFLRKTWDNWTSDSVTRTAEGAKSSSYRSVFADWKNWKSGTITKTADSKTTTKYTSYQSNWKSWTSSTITKTADGETTSSYTSSQSSWKNWVSGTITKTADGKTTSAYTSYQSNWRSWVSGTITKTADGTTTSSYRSSRSGWQSWTSSTVTKTANAATGSRWSSVKAQWDGIKNKTVTATLSLSATVSSMKNWLNSNIITPLNNAIHIVFPNISIPKLATGGVVNHATMALVGEAGREAVLPLEQNTGWMDELAGRINGSGGAITVQLVLDGRVITEKVIQRINREAQRTGVHPLLQNV